MVNALSTPVQPLRIGLFVNGPRVRGWEFRVVQELVRNPALSIVSVFENTATVTSARRWRTLPWRMLNRVEGAVTRRLFANAWKNQDLHPDDLVELTTLLPEATWRRVLPVTSSGGMYHEFGAQDLAVLESDDLDVVIRFGFNVLRGRVLDIPRFGIWSYHHADNRENRGGPPGFWEFFTNNATTGATVQILTEDIDGGRVICRGRYPTFPFSWNENRRRLVWRSRFLMTDALGRLARRRDRRDVFEDDPRPLGLYAHPLFRAPGPCTSVLSPCKAVWRIVIALTKRRLRPGQWRLVYRESEPEGASLRRFTQLKPDKSKFWADPFHVQQDGRNWLIFEEYDFRAEKAHIACGEIKEGGLQDIRAILERPCHLSYPFVFRHDGHLWMIPESYKAGVVDLYQCESFPDRWVKSRTLMSGISAADTTLVEHDGKWWIFTNIERSGLGDHSCELHVFFTDDPVTGDWQPHASNPVVTDCDSARMAGAFFIDRYGRLIRCAQRRGREYGEALKFFHITELSENNYSEQLAELVEPRWVEEAVGFHHCHITAGFAVFDLRVETWWFSS